MQRESTMLLNDNLHLINEYSKNSIDLVSKLCDILDSTFLTENGEVYNLLRKNLDIQILAENSLQLIKTL